MGIIQRQVIKNNAISLMTVAIGAFAQLMIYPQDGMVLKGYADGLLKAARLLSPFFILGSTSVVVKYLPYLQQERDAAASILFSRSFYVILATLTFSLSVLLVFGDKPLRWIDANVTQLGYVVEKPWTVLVLVGCICFASLLTTNLTNYRRIAMPVIFNSLVPKLGLPFLFLLVLHVELGRQVFTYGLLGIYVATVLGLIVYTKYTTATRLTLAPLELNPYRTQQLYALAGFSTIGSIGSVLSTQLDTFFVSTHLGDSPTGIYSFAAFVAMVMFIPLQAVNAIAAPIISEKWKAKDIAHIGFLYRESAAVLFFVGGLIYVGGIVCLPSLFTLTGNETLLAPGYTVFIILGMGQLIDLLTSVNGTIINNSDYFRWNTVFVLVLGAMNIALNFYFVLGLSLGIAGAALATLCSLAFYNMMKIWLLYRKLDILPFSKSILFTVAVILAVWGGVSSIPLLESSFLNILIRGSLVVVLFGAYAYFTNGVPALQRLLVNGKDSLFGQ